jgi:hypothetical protein
MLHSSEIRERSEECTRAAPIMYCSTQRSPQDSRACKTSSFVLMACQEETGPYATSFPLSAEFRQSQEYMWALSTTRTSTFDLSKARKKRELLTNSQYDCWRH